MKLCSKENGIGLRKLIKAGGIVKVDFAIIYILIEYVCKIPRVLPYFLLCDSAKCEMCFVYSIFCLGWRESNYRFYCQITLIEFRFIFDIHVSFDSLYFNCQLSLRKKTISIGCAFFWRWLQNPNEHFRHILLS